MSTPTPRTDAVMEEDMKHNKSFLTEDLLVHAYTLERELAAERARLDWLKDHGWITGEPCDRAAIDAAMKEGA